MPNPIALFDTSEGTFKAEIFVDKMPLTASNFLDLVKNGFYDGLHIHRYALMKKSHGDWYLMDAPFVMTASFFILFLFASMACLDLLLAHV